MINLPKKPPPSLMVFLGIPSALLFSYYCFLKVGFNLSDFKENLENRYLVTDPLFNPKWSWAIENASEALVETIQIAILASIVGCFVALPLSFYASQTTNQNKVSYFLYKSFFKLSAYNSRFVLGNDVHCCCWTRTICWCISIGNVLTCNYG